MSIAAFDTLAYANKLKTSGVASNEAEAQAEALSEVMQDFIKNQLSTKQDLSNTQNKLSSEITQLENKLTNLENKVGKEMQQLEMRMYAFMVKTSVFVVGILGGLQTLFKFVHS